MSEPTYRIELARAFSAVAENAEAVRDFAVAVEAEVKRLWADNADLRDEVHALSNRIEALTRLVQVHGVALGNLATEDGDIHDPHDTLRAV